MKEEDVNLIAQFLIGMKDALDGLEGAQKSKDAEKMAMAKKEILNFQAEISKLL